jgi:tRNA synthetases class I (W and Y)
VLRGEENQLVSCQGLFRAILTDDRHLLHPRAAVRSATLQQSCHQLSLHSVVIASWHFRRAAEYWPLVMDIARRNNLKRIVRCGQIMGRSEEGEMSAAQIFYPCMQCADIFFLKVQLVAMTCHQQCCRQRWLLTRSEIRQKSISQAPFCNAIHVEPGDRR